MQAQVFCVPNDPWEPLYHAHEDIAIQGILCPRVIEHWEPLYISNM